MKLTPLAFKPCGQGGRKALAGIEGEAEAEEEESRFRMTESPATLPR